MKNTLKPSILIVLSALLFFSCKKKEQQDAVGNDAPEIELVSVSPGTVKEYLDKISIVIKYKDINGDLGDENPDELSLSVKDSRLSNADKYHVKPLAPNTGKNIHIEGELRIELNSMFLLGGGNTELSSLTIKLKDRAGNWSNEVTTQAIVINK